MPIYASALSRRDLSRRARRVRRRRFGRRLGVALASTGALASVLAERLVV